MKEFFAGIQGEGNRMHGISYAFTEKPWGMSVSLSPDTDLIWLKGETSVHYHPHMGEEYILLQGNILVYTGERGKTLVETVGNLKTNNLLPGDKIIIERNRVHIPVNQKQGGSFFIARSYGPYEGTSPETIQVYDSFGRDEALAAQWEKLGYEKRTNFEKLFDAIVAGGQR